MTQVYDAYIKYSFLVEFRIKYEKNAEVFK